MDALFTTFLLLAGLTSALSGFEGDEYYPLCAHGCLRAFSIPLLSCSAPDHPITGMMVINVNTWPSCFASDEAYLTSLAWCVHDQCASFDLSTLELEIFWANKATGDPTVPQNGVITRH